MAAQPAGERVETLGQRIASLRERAGLLQPQLASMAGIPTATLKNWEQDRRQPYASGLAALAAALGVALGPLLEGVTFPTVEEPGRAGRPRKPPEEPAAADPPAPARRRKPAPADVQAPALGQGEPSGEKAKKPRKQKGG